MSNAVVRARIDQRINDEAAAILAAAGLTILRCLSHNVDADGGRVLPFDSLVPNAIKPMKAGTARRPGDGRRRG